MVEGTADAQERGRRSSLGGESQVLPITVPSRTPSTGRGGRPTGRLQPKSRRRSNPDRLREDLPSLKRARTRTTERYTEAVTVITVRQAGAFSYEDLEDAPYNGYRREIIGGSLIVTRAPNFRHQLVSARLHVALWGAQP